MDFITLSIGLVLGIFIGAGAIFIYLKLNNNNEVDIESYSKNLKDLKDEIKGYEDTDRKSTRLNSSHSQQYRMPSSA